MSSLERIKVVKVIFRADIIQGTSDTNRDKAITGVACLLGAVSGGLDVTDGVSSKIINHLYCSYLILFGKTINK